MAVFATAALAQDQPAAATPPTQNAPAPADLPRIAVYVTGSGVSENEKSALGTRLLASLINSGRYMGIERSSSFLAEVDKEQLKQRSGAIDDGQISALGKQFGVKFVCVANITPVLGDFQVSARIINVETAQISFIGESYSRLQNVVDLVQVSDQVVRNMFSGQVATLRTPKQEQAQEPAPEPPAQQPQQPQQPPKQAETEQEMQERVRAAVEREERERQEKKQMEAERKRMSSERMEQERAMRGERARQRGAEKRRVANERAEQTVMKKVKIGGGVGWGTSGVTFLDAGVAGVCVVNKNMQIAPQVNYRGGLGVDFSGVSIPLLVQYSTDYRRTMALFVEGGVGADWLDNGSASVFNGELMVGLGVAFGRCVHIDFVRFNLGIAYSSWNIMNVRVVF